MSVAPWKEGRLAGEAPEMGTTVKGRSSDLGAVAATGWSQADKAKLDASLSPLLMFLPN